MPTSASIAQHRLHNQRLTGPKFTDPVAAVRWFGAVQAQDYAAAKWSLAQRMRAATDRSLDAAFDSGRILRTHVMRPTWHFVTPEDIRWMQALTAARVRASLGTYDRKLELTPDVLKQARHILTKALEGGRHLTRAELSAHLERGGITARGQRLAHLLAHAELEALICSGPRRGKQFTYALLDERAAAAPRLHHEEALATLARRYFASHGPAQLQDFSWWSGLRLGDARESLELVKGELVSLELDGRTYWLAPDSRPRRPSSPHALLLSIFDEYTIAYKDRRDIAAERVIERLLTMGSALTAVMILDGRVVGTWKRNLLSRSAKLTLRPMGKLSRLARRAFAAEASRYERFLRVPVSLA